MHSLRGIATARNMDDQRKISQSQKPATMAHDLTRRVATTATCPQYIETVGQVRFITCLYAPHYNPWHPPPHVVTKNVSFEAQRVQHIQLIFSHILLLLWGHKQYCVHGQYCVNSLHAQTLGCTPYLYQVPTSVTCKRDNLDTETIRTLAYAAESSSRANSQLVNFSPALKLY